MATMFIGSAAYGQLSLRPQVGINFPSFSDEIIHGEFDGEVGYQFGADLQIGGSFYIQPGLNFQSNKLSIENVGDIKVSRINVPVMVGYKFFENEDSRAFGVRIFAGPNFAFHVNEDLDEAFTDIDKDDIKDFQIAGLVGAGVDISILFVDLAYKFGLSDFFEEDVADGSINLFVVNAGIRLGF